MVFAKIVDRRPQNSRLGLPWLRSRISGLEAGVWDVDEQAARAEGLLSPRTGARNGLRAAPWVVAEVGLAWESNPE